jgi:hypothetical protein
MQSWQGDLLRLFETFSHAMQGLQGVVFIIAAAAFLAGLYGERLRAKLSRQAWQRRRWRGERRVSSSKTGVTPITDPAAQLRLVMVLGENAASSHGRRLRFVRRRKGNQYWAPSGV